MKMLRPLLIVLTSGLLTAGPLRAELETFLEADQPPVQGGVSHVNPGTEQGMAWKWNPSDGRRDYGQIFRAEKTFPADELAVQVLFSDPFRAPVRAPFELEFLEFPSGNLNGKPDVLATLKGELPPNPGLGTGESSWLRMRFPVREFREGETYGFLLRFEKEGAGEQNIVLRVTPSSTPDGGHGILSNGGSETLEKGPSLNFLLGQAEAARAEGSSVEPRELLVNRLASTGYRTIASAVTDARPGDTIRLASGSGPYRETLFLRQSGTPDRPIIFDGAGETITGFEPLVFQQKDGEWSCDLTAFFASRKNIQGFTKRGGRWASPVPGAFPAVLVHRGKRVFQSAATGKFEGLRISPDGARLVLESGADPEGWEISARDQVVMILNASHQIYRNLKATGSLNDGFNLHGTGTGLVFENIEGAQNLDEGFSAHDTIVCSVAGGRFWENDNGIGNVGASVMDAENLKTYANAGWGVWVLDGQVDLRKVKAWDNGVAQIALHGRAKAALQEVSVVPPASAAKPHLSYQESATRPDARSHEVAATAVCDGTVSVVSAPEAKVTSRSPSL